MLLAPERPFSLKLMEFAHMAGVLNGLAMTGHSLLVSTPYADQTDPHRGLISDALALFAVTLPDAAARLGKALIECKTDDEVTELLIDVRTNLAAIKTKWFRYGVDVRGNIGFWPHQWLDDGLDCVTRAGDHIVCPSC